MAEAPKATPLEKENLNHMANVFAQHVKLKWIDEQDNEALQQLPRDMQLESYVIGALTGLMSLCLQSVPREHHNTVVENVIAYVPLAAEQALAALDAEARGQKPQ